MHSPPKVSVVMPVYNAERYLAAAIDSILAQTFTDFELVAVDDGSTDASAEILDRYAARDKRVRMIRQENAGVTRTSNVSVYAARGEYVARMDADDISWPDRLEKEARFLDANPDVVAVGTQVRLIDPDGRVLRTLPMPCDHETIDSRHLTTAQSQFCNPATMMRRQAFLDIGGYDETIPVAQDFDLWLRLAEKGRVGNLDSIALDYRLHFSSIGYTKRSQQIDVARDAVERALARRGLTMELPDPSYPQHDNRSTVFRKWGWWALMDGNRATARLYASRALLAAPWSLENWRLAVMALRGR